MDLVQIYHKANILIAQTYGITGVPGIPCQFRVRDGGHTSEYWHSALYMCLPFVSRCFAK